LTAPVLAEVGRVLAPGGVLVFYASITSGLAIEHVAEPGGRPVPTVLAIRARKRGTHG